MGPVLTGPTTLQTGPDPVLGPGVAGVIGDEPLLPYRDHRDDQGCRPLKASGVVTWRDGGPEHRALKPGGGAMSGMSITPAIGSAAFVSRWSWLTSGTVRRPPGKERCYSV